MSTDFTLTNQVEITLGIGEAKIFSRPVQLVCFGLGSCVAVFLYDTKSAISAGAHIMLPGRCSNAEISSTSYCVHAIEMMLNGMKALGCHVPFVQAKVAGGANVLQSQQWSIGKENIVAVKEELALHSIKIVGNDLGGAISRTVRFDSRTRTVETRSAYGSSYYLKF